MTYIGPSVDNYTMYMGKNSVNIAAVEFEPSSHCITCQNKPISIDIDKSQTVEELVKKY